MSKKKLYDFYVVRPSDCWGIWAGSDHVVAIGVECWLTKNAEGAFAPGIQGFRLGDLRGLILKVAVSLRAWSSEVIGKHHHE